MGKSYQSLDDLLNDCTVRVKTKNGYGTGFFISPGLILTCAHVIESAFKERSPISVYCRYNQKTISAEQMGAEDVFTGPYPDIALLHVDVQDHPCVLLGTEFRAFTKFYSYGYTKDHPDGETTTVECEGTLEYGGTLIKLKDGQVKPGASGSPLLNKKTGAVCGMITNTRDRNSDLGGAGAPMEFVFEKFHDLERQNQALHRRDNRWRDLLEKDTVAKPLNIVTTHVYDKPGMIKKPKHWVGREELLHRVNPLLDQSHKVLLTGMGGIGKTSLAQMVVEERLQARSQSILWLEVGDEKVDILIEALAEKCGDDKIFSMPNTEAKKLALKKLLEDYKAGMLVIDDVRNLDALDDLLETTPDELPVLMTSRMSFETDDILDVSELPLAEALELLAKTSSVKDYSTDESAKALCQLFGCHPLAIEIAGARIKERRGLTPARLLERLKSNPIKLSSLRRGEIRPLLDDCVEDLTEALQSVFIAFGKFSGKSFTPALLSIFLNKPIEDVTDALEGLVLRNLVKSTLETNEYYLHDLIFHYVQTVYGPNEQENDHLIQTGLAYLESHRRDFNLIGIDLLNLLGIAQIAEEIDLVKLISYLAIGSYPLQEDESYVDKRGYSIALIGQLDRAIEATRELGAGFNSTEHYLLEKRGAAAFWRGEYELAAEKYREELLLSPNDERRAFVGSNFANTLAFCGRIEESRKYFEMAKGLAEKLHNDELRVYVLEEEIWAAGYLKDYARALRVAEIQLPLAETLYKKDDKTYKYLAFALMNFGSAKLELAKEGNSDLNSVLDKFKRAKALAEKYENNPLLAQAFASLGEYYHYVDDRNLAQLNFNQALKIRRSLEMTQYVKEREAFMQEHGYSIES